MASTYPATSNLPENASIVSRWLLDEASGNRSDSVGSNTLTDNNTVGAGTGYSNATSGVDFDNSADFENNNSEYLNRADNAALSITGDLTMSCWVNLESAIGTNDQDTLCSKYDPGTGDRSWLWWLRDLSGTKTMQLSVSDDGSAITSADAGAVTMNTGTWYLLTVVYDASAGETKFFQDGEQIGSTVDSQKTSIADTDADFILGSFKDNDTPRSFLDGLMNDFIIWEAELTDTEVSDLYDLYTTLYDLYTTGPAVSYSYLM